MSKHSQPTNRTAYITKCFRPKTLAQPNSRNAKTEGDWLKAEADAFLADGVDIVIAEDPKGLQALTYRCNILAVDKVVYPV
jgi:hypothetical protein